MAIFFSVPWYQQEANINTDLGQRERRISPYFTSHTHNSFSQNHRGNFLKGRNPAFFLEIKCCYRPGRDLNIGLERHKADKKRSKPKEKRENTNIFC